MSIDLGRSRLSVRLPGLSGGSNRKALLGPAGIATYNQNICLWFAPTTGKIFSKFGASAAFKQRSIAPFAGRVLHRY
jgi:hypothetical protein